MQSLFNEVNIIQAANAAAAGQTEVDTSVLDMAGYEGVCFIASLGTVTSGSVLQLEIKQNTASSTSSPTPTSTNVKTAQITDSGGASSNKMLIADCWQPRQRYVFAALTRTTQNAVVNCIIAIQYRGKKRPPTADATVLASASDQGT